MRLNLRNEQRIIRMFLRKIFSMITKLKISIFCCLLFALFVVRLGFAYFPEVTILDREAIQKLSDEQLIQAYTDTIVEIEAQNAFHATSGFVPREYKAYKDLLYYRIYLWQEMDKRKIEPPLVTPPQSVPVNPPVK